MLIAEFFSHVSPAKSGDVGAEQVSFLQVLHHAGKHTKAKKTDWSEVQPKSRGR